jgi:rhamnosyltransferase
MTLNSMSNCAFASVTVAYNAVKALPRQMDALLGQTRPLREIIVVDNASTDGTSAMLAECYPQVTVLQMPENLGAAGAWAAGLTYAALEKGHDWVWTFDDDSVPGSGALGALVAGLEEVGSAGGSVGIAAPMAVCRRTGAYYPPWFWRDGFVKASPQQIRQRIWFADLVMASGALVGRHLVEEVGVPLADFFMDVFDLEYCIRARSRGYKIVIVSHAELSHEVGSTRRISLLGYKRSWTNQPAWREYYISRNLTYLAWRLYPSRATRRSILRYLLVHLLGVLMFSSNRLACAVRMFQGLRDGYRGRLGIRFRPGVRGLCRRSDAMGVTGGVEVRQP